MIEPPPPKSQNYSPGACSKRSPQNNDILDRLIRRSDQQAERMAALEKALFGEHYRFSPKNQSSNPGAYSPSPPQNKKRQSSQVYSTSSPGTEPDRRRNQNKRQRLSSQNTENWWPNTTVTETPKNRGQGNDSVLADKSQQQNVNVVYTSAKKSKKAHGAPTRHNGATCDVCRTEAFEGRRHKCLECDNYDLCD